MTVDIAGRIAAACLTPAERRVAQVVLDDPEAIAFGTVATVAARAQTSGPTVVRTASKVGFEGFAALQSAVQEELAARLRPAAERIRHQAAPDPLSESLAVELENVHATLTGVDPGVYAEVVRRLADRRHRVAVVSGEASFGVAAMFADGLSMLRDGVEIVAGSSVRVARRLALLDPDDTLVAIDLRRYDRWVLRTAEDAAATDVHVVAVTDSRLSPLARSASEVFVVDAKGAGPFDSHVGTLALLNAVVTGVAKRLRRSATARLDRIEASWHETGSLVEP